MKKILFAFLTLIIVLTSASCSNENNNAVNSDEAILNTTNDSLTFIEIETEPTTSPIYQYDDVINDFLNKYNTIQETKIDANMISKYYHHGREHDDQISLDICDDVRIIISSTYVNGGEEGIKVFIDIYNHTDMSSVKEMYLLFTKVFNSNISEETLENTWSIVTDTDYNNIIKIDNLEFYYTKGSFLSIEGSF